MGFSLTSVRVPTEAFPHLPTDLLGAARSPHIQQIICGLINDGTLHPDVYLPAEHELAGHWSVARQTVHRALVGLQKADVLTSKRGVGWHPTVSTVVMPGAVPTTHEPWCAVFEVLDGPRSRHVAVPGLADVDAAVEFGTTSAGAKVTFLFCAALASAATFQSVYRKGASCPDDSTPTIPSCTPTTS